MYRGNEGWGTNTYDVLYIDNKINPHTGSTVT